MTARLLANDPGPLARCCSRLSDLSGARTVLGPDSDPAIASRLARVLPAGIDFASQLRTQLDLARRAGR